MKKIKVRGKSLWRRIADRVPKVEVCFSRMKKPGRIKKAAFVLVPVALLGTGLGVGLSFLRNDKKTPVAVVNVASYNNRRIYLTSKDNLTIPLTVALNKKNTMGEEIKDLFDLLKTNSKANTASITGLIPADTKLNSLEVFHDELILDVSQEFLNYEPSQEVNMLESLAYTFGDYPSINMLSIYVDGQKLERMPKNSTVVPDFLEKTFGINRQEENAGEIAGKQMVNVFYTKMYDDREYLIPVSQYVDSSTSKEVQLVSALQKEVSNTLGLTLAKEYEYLEATQDRVSDNETEMNLVVKSDAMKEEGVIRKELFQLVALTLEESNFDQKVNFYVEDQQMMVEGLIDSGSYQVSSFIYNAVEL